MEDSGPARVFFSVSLSLFFKERVILSKHLVPLQIASRGRWRQIESALRSATLEEDEIKDKGKRKRRPDVGRVPSTKSNAGTH